MSKNHWKNPTAKHEDHGKGSGKRRLLARSVGASGALGRFRSSCLCTGCIYNLGIDGEGVNMSVFCKMEKAHLYSSQIQECKNFARSRHPGISEEVKTAEVFA